MKSKNEKRRDALFRLERGLESDRKQLAYTQEELKQLTTRGGTKGQLHEVHVSTCRARIERLHREINRQEKEIARLLELLGGRP